RKPSSSSPRDNSQIEVQVGTWLLLVNMVDTVQQHRCAHTGTNAAKLSFRRSWSHEELNTYITEIVFPLQMQYAMTATSRKGKGKQISLWKLINKEKQRYELAVTKGPPTGEDLFHYRGRNSNIILGM
ncbi:hypothetical protein PISMIDRAFT_37688, partial [Pisolithus microcarpus 441]